MFPDKNSYYHNAEKKRNWFLWALIVVGALWAAVLIITMFSDAQKSLETTIQNKIDHGTKPVIVEKYDSATQVKVDNIEVYRQMSHQHVDNLYDNQLQDVLDSLYNSQ